VADHGAQAVTGGTAPVRVAYVTTSRSDYGPAYWLLHDLFADSRFVPLLIVAGSHLSAAHGETITEIEQDGFAIARRIDFLRDAGDDGLGFSLGLGRGLAGMGAALDALRPDVLVMLGDRLELLAMAGAAVSMRVPIAHISGGDVTEGALDEQVRHAVTKMSHVHFPGTELAGTRIRRMGEEGWRVHVVGDPALEHFRRAPRGTVPALAQRVGFMPDRRTLLVTLHPETASGDNGAALLDALVTSLEAYQGSLLITAPAPDPGHERIRARLAALVAGRTDAAFVDSLGSTRYHTALALVGAMVGNSSSGLIEAASVSLPVVNVGVRQQGRERGANVLDAGATGAAISAAIARATSAEFRDSIKGMINPYGDGGSSARIRNVLAELPDRGALLTKRFVDAAAAPTR
jgi:UDP-hydrolysing UDP-N-acetyl-D-glucosamine 2-epimerase